MVGEGHRHWYTMEAQPNPLHAVLTSHTVNSNPIVYPINHYIKSEGNKKMPLPATATASS